MNTFEHSSTNLFPCLCYHPSIHPSLHQDAENAIVTMNGQWLGGRTIKTNWASGKGNMITLAKNNSGVFYPFLSYSVLFYPTLFYSILLCSILSYSVLFYLIFFYFLHLLSYSSLFYFTPSYFVSHYLFLIYFISTPFTLHPLISYLF